MHSVARIVDLLRQKPGSKGLVTANGGLLTKHALCIYSTDAPDQPFAWATLQEAVEATPRRGVAGDHDGEVTIESYAVMYDAAAAPTTAHVACLLDDGRRTWANVTDVDTVSDMTRQEFCGRAAKVDRKGGLQVH
jgi:acetyl-CoA C-acetyltransferase